MGESREPLEQSTRLTADAAGIAAVHRALDQFWAAVDSPAVADPDRPPAGRWREEFATAVVEIAANIVRHGVVRGDPAARGADGFDLRIRLASGAVEARFTDRGRPLAPDGGMASAMTVPVRPDPVAGTDPATVGGPGEVGVSGGLPESGYGLGIVRTAVDDVTYQRLATGVNVWTLVKSCRTGGTP